jgi:hypothetical protein
MTGDGGGSRDCRTSGRPRHQTATPVTRLARIRSQDIPFDGFCDGQFDGVNLALPAVETTDRAVPRRQGEFVSLGIPDGFVS